MPLTGAGPARTLRRLLCAGVALGALLAGCDPDCALIDQDVVIVSPDRELQTLIDSCVAGVPAAGEICAPLDARSYRPIDCGCLALCRRVLEIIDQFPGEETIERCRYALTSSSMFDAGQGQQETATVQVTYRPSSCP